VRLSVVAEFNEAKSLDGSRKMQQVIKICMIATVVIAFAAGVAPAQLYTAPNINTTVMGHVQPQTIDSRMHNLATQRASAGYGGLNSPYNYYLSPSSNSMAASRPRVGLGAGTPTRTSKPFSSYSGSSSPSVSPYLNLFRTDLSGGGNFNYSTLVQPQLQQQQVNQQLERQAMQANRRLQSIAAQADYNAQGSKDQAPTGHQTVFGYTGRYYQQPQVRQKRR
jgi:hypothetical protein